MDLKDRLKKNINVDILFFLLVFISLLFFYSRGFIPHDEGWILNPAQRILGGEIPYRDFHYIYTPGAAYVVSLFFKFFKESILVSRLTALFFVLLTLLLLRKISLRVNTSPFLYVLPVLIFITWGPMHINFAWPVIFSIFSGLTTCYLLLVSYKNDRFLIFFLSGVFTAMTVLFKQNFGLALMLNNLIYLVFLRNRRITFLKYHALGFLLTIALFLAYLFQNDALIPFYNDMYFFMFYQIIQEGMQSTPFVYPDLLYKQITKGIFYSLPLILGIPAIAVTFKKNKQFIFLASFCILFYIFGIRPTTDYPHLVPLLSLTGILFLSLYTLIENNLVKKIILILQILFICLGFYSAFFLNYYRWNPPLKVQDRMVGNSRMGILVDSSYASYIPAIDRYIRNNVNKNGYVFIYRFSPSFYFLSERKNPTKFIFLPPQILSNKDQAEIIKNLTDRKVSIILTDTNIREDKSILSEFVKGKYSLDKEIGNYQFWKKR